MAKTAVEQESIRQQDLDLIRSIAKRMVQPEKVKNLVSDLNNKNPKPFFETPNWHDLSIGGGYPGVLPLFIELDQLFPNDRWDLVGNEYIKSIIQSIEIHAFDSFSMFSGLAGVCFYIRQASRNETRYKKLLERLDTLFIKGIQTLYITPFSQKLEKNQAIPPSIYEVIQGLSGIGIYALMNMNKQPFKELTEEIIRLLIHLTQTININDTVVPGWYIHPDHFFLEDDKKRFPNGLFNLGLSHGIPGVLAFLSIALIHQVDLKGQKEAIKTIASWLSSKLKREGDRYRCDSKVSFDEEIHHQGTEQSKSKDAWCYGIPGIARSLYLAGVSLQDVDQKKLAEEVFCSVFKSSQEEWDLSGPTFCHGISGLLLITHLMARDTQNPFLIDQVSKLRQILLSHYDSTFPFGFKNCELMVGGGYFWSNRTDILEGSSGVLLSLLSLHTNHIRWHLPFLIDA